MTNYDRIKAMSVEEMATIIMCPAETDCCFEPPKRGIRPLIRLLDDTRKEDEGK